MGSRAVPGEGRVIKLSDVKVRLQYRWRVRQRLMVIHFARLQGPTAAGRRFGVSVRTIRRWRVRWREGAVQGLVPRYPRRRGRRITPRVVELIGQARRDLAYGAQRTQLWLRRVHDVRVAVGTIQRVFRDIGLPRLRRTRKRVPRQMKLFEKAEPGESVQVDVKFVKIAVCRAFPFRIRKLQCDNGQEFSFAFALAVQALGIRHRYIRPRRPQQNGKVERSHRIDQEEFWGRHRFSDFDAAAVGLRAWEATYNYQRFSLALQGRTPAEKLAALTPAPAA